MSIRGSLLRRYKTQWDRDGHPGWAHPVVPAVPLVGENFVCGEGLLVYGSAENFTGGVGDRAKDKFERHREHLDLWKHGSPKDRPFFPDVHCQPITNGGLLVAAAFLLTLERKPISTKDPGTFIESLAVGNFGKFAVNQQVNADYARDAEKLQASLPYVMADLRLLRPKLVLLPRRMWKHHEIQEALAPLLPNACVVPAYQCQPQPINAHLVGKYDADAKTLKHKHRKALWRAWCGNLLHGLKEANIWHYLAHVEECWEEARTAQQHAG